METFHASILLVKLRITNAAGNDASTEITEL